MLENKVYIFDNLISKKYQDYLEKITYIIPFNLHAENSSGEKDEINILNLKGKLYDRPQMTHGLVDKFDNNSSPSYYYDFISPLFYHVQSYFNFSFNFEVLRSKINLKHQVPSTHKSQFNFPHIDINPPIFDSWILLYYVNNSDGDTIIFNETYNPSETPTKLSLYKTITPKKGRIIFFPANIYHSANFPTINFTRIIINNVLKIYPHNLATINTN